MTSKEFAEKYAGQFVQSAHKHQEGIVIGYTACSVVLNPSKTAWNAGFGVITLSDFEKIAGTVTFVVITLGNRSNTIGYLGVDPSVLYAVNPPALPAPSVKKTYWVTDEEGDLTEMQKALRDTAEKPTFALIEYSPTVVKKVQEEPSIPPAKEPCPRHYTGDRDLSCTCKPTRNLVIDSL